MTRGKRLVALVLPFLVGSGCAKGPAPAAPPPAGPPPLHLAPLTDLVAAAGLAWVADVHPRALLSDPALMASRGHLLSEGDLDAFAASHGGVDLRGCDELLVASYPGSTLFLAREVVSPAKIEGAFSAEVATTLGRAEDLHAPTPTGAITRSWGSLGNEQEALVVFGLEAVGLVHGDEAPLRAAELFAQGRLKRAKPVLAGPPLDRVATLLGDAPFRFAAPGPFHGDWTTGLGGLLAVATGVGVAVRVADQTVHIDAVVTGPWGARADEAKGGIEKAFTAFANSGAGRLFGFHDPVAPTRVTATDDSVRVETQVGLAKVVRGLEDAMSGSIGEVMTRVGGARP